MGLSGAGDVVIAQRLAGALRRGWWYGTVERQRWVRAALAAVAATTPSGIAAKLELADAMLAVSSSQYRPTLAAAERALARYRTLGDELGIAEAKRNAGLALVFLGGVEQGRARINEALAVFRKRGNRKLVGGALRDLAYAAGLAGDPGGAKTLFSEALAHFRATGAERAMASVAADLAEIEFGAGDPNEALRLAREALAAWRPFSDRRSAALHLNNMAAYLVALDRYDEARERAKEALAISRGAEQSVHAAFNLQHLAAIAALRSTEAANVALERNRAAHLLGYVDARLAALEASREYTEQQEYERARVVLENALGASELKARMQEGTAWSEEEAAREALQV